MDPSAGREQRTKVGGLVVAVVAFAFSRASLLVVADPMGSFLAFLTTGLFPLVFGLSLTVFGVSLAVSTFEPWYVNTVAAWTIAGAVGVGLVTVVSLLNPMLSGSGLGLAPQSSPVVANTLVAGAVGGALVGVRSARNRRQRRRLARQSSQAVVLNRILRDEVLNAVTAIRARLEHVRVAGAEEESLDTIDRGTERVRDAVEDVGFLARADEDTALEPTSLGPVLRRELADARERFPEATIEADVAVGDDVEVRASDRLGTVFAQLCATAVERHPDRAPRIRVSATTDGAGVDVTVTDDGDPPTDKQTAVLAAGAVSTFDDPAISFGYPVVSLLVDQYGGDVDVERTDDRTRVTATLPRVHDGGTPSRRHGVEPAGLIDAAVAALVAGVAMGVVLQVFANTIPVIGSLYGVSSPVIGWITHLFHSVVFGLLFVAALGRPSLRRRVASLRTTVAAALVFALALAVVAAGFVMPLWLNTVGVPSPVPRVFPAGVAAHLVWAVVLGTVYRLRT